MREITPTERSLLKPTMEEVASWPPVKTPKATVKPLPGFERYGHVGSYKRPNRHLAQAHETKKPLDVLNDSLPLGYSLHPTKGWRFRSERSLRADLLYGEIRHDLVAWLRTWLP